MANMLAAAASASLWPVCYNHLEKRADFKCFDCKYEGVIHLCPQCNIQVHSLDIFRAHRVEQLELKGKERRLSQDVGDIEKIVEVERDLLQTVLTKLKYTEQEEKHTLGQLIELQSATKKRMAEIKDCEATIEKAFSYLAKMSTMIEQCSMPVEGSDNDAAFVKDPAAENAAEQPSAQAVQNTADERPSQDPPSEEQMVPPNEPLITSCLPAEMKDKEVFPVSVIGSLTRTGCFWITKIGDVEEGKQKQIGATIRNYYVKIGGFGNPVVAKEGLFCAAYHRKSKELSRARVECITNSGMIRIRYLDLGTVDEVSQASLCGLPVDLVDAPFQAMECCLLPDPDMQLPYEAKWCFKDLTFSKVLMASVEGQVTDKKGNVLHHVLLGSCGEIPVCINSQVAKLVESQKIALEDRPLQPKAEKTETVEVPSAGDADKSDQPTETAPPSNLAKERDTESSTREEEEESVKTETEISSTNEVAVSDDKVIVTAKDNDAEDDDKPALRADAAEFVPVPPESDSTQETIPQAHNTREQSSVPGILHLPSLLETPVTAVPAAPFERFNSQPLGTQLPAGCVDFATYNQILTKCSLNMIREEDLPKARFLVIKSDPRRIIEAMKFNVWCSNVYSNQRLNQVFFEATSKKSSPKERGPVFLLFAGMRTTMFLGMAEMVSAVDPEGSCPMLNDPFRFGFKMSGRCNIKWIFANNVYYKDINHVPRKNFYDIADGTALDNTLGQQIVKAFDSGGNFTSILQQGMKWHQSYLDEQQEIEEAAAAAEPVWIAPEFSDGLPTSQEDWDQEIEDNLKAAKSSEPENVDASKVQEAPKDTLCENETDFSAGSEVVAPVFVDETSREQTGSPVLSESDTQVSMEDHVHVASSTDAQFQTVDASSDTVLADSDSALEEGVTEVVDAHKEEVSVVIPELSQGSDHQEEVQNDIPVNVDDAAGSSTESRGTVEASAPETQEVKGKGSLSEEGQTSVTSSEQEVVAESSDFKEGQASVTSSEQGVDVESLVSKESDASVQSAEKAVVTESSASKEKLANLRIDQETEAEGAAPKEVYDSQSIFSNESDWETSLVECVSVSDATGTVSECEKDKGSSKETFDSKDNSSCGTVDVQKESSADLEYTNHPDDQDDSCTQGSAVHKNQHVSRGSSDETVEAAIQVQQKLSETVHNQDENRLESLPCNSSGGEAVADNPGSNTCGGESKTFAGDKVVDGSETVATDTVGGSRQANKGQTNGKAGAKRDCASSEPLSQEVHESSEMFDFDDFPVEIGKEHLIEARESLSSGGTFWARVLRNSKEEANFMNAMKRMRNHIVAKPKHLDPADIHIYKQCAVKGRDGDWFRALVEKILDKGKIEIRLLDLGDVWQVHQRELRVLDDEYYASPPAQAFECTLCNENPTNKKEKGRTSKLIKRNKRIRVLVKNYSHDGTVGVQVLS